MGSKDSNPFLKARMSADIEGDFAVFITGMRINNFWKVHKWWPTFKSMAPILIAVRSNPELGLLDLHSYMYPRGAVMITYWRSIEHLERFANNPEEPHKTAWRNFLSRVGTTGDVGIWHETYVIPAGHYEAVYTNIPFAAGLAAASRHVPVQEMGHTAVRRREAALRKAESAPDREDVPASDAGAVVAGAPPPATTAEG
ncbi:MAG: DUF4188 domain-containing protein [Micromonosporaceae bacterium]